LKRFIFGLAVATTVIGMAAEVYSGEVHEVCALKYEFVTGIVHVVD
jgi:hypothetical protein